MKKIFFTLSLVLLATVIVLGQRGDKNMTEESRKKIEASKVAYMTTYLDLTAAESAKFWPVYNEYQDKAQDLRKARGERRKISEITDAEATTRLDKYLSYETGRLQLKQEYISKYRKIISDRKVLMIYYAESEFRKQMVKRYTENKGERERSPSGKERK